MTQLEELLSQQDTLDRKIAKVQEQLKSTADSALIAEYRRDIRIYRKLKDELREQIGQLDPAQAVQPGRKRNGVSLDRDAGEGNASGSLGGIFREAFADLEGRTVVPAQGSDLTSDSRAEREAPEESDKAQRRLLRLYRKWSNEAAAAFSEKQAQAFDLRYNGGWSLKKIAETRQVHPSVAGLMIRRADRRLRNWIGINLAVLECRDGKAFFDFDTFLERYPFAFPSLGKEILLRVLDAPERRYPNLSALAKDMGLTLGSISQSVQSLRGCCRAYGIPDAAIPKVLRRCGVRELDRVTLCRIQPHFSLPRAPEGRGWRRGERAAYSGPGLDEAVARKLAECGIAMSAEVRAYLLEGEASLNENYIAAARARMDEGRTIEEIRERFGVARNNLSWCCRRAVNALAQYACIRYDVKRAFEENGGGWEVLLRTWQLFPEKETALAKLLIAEPEKTVRDLQQATGRDACNVRRSLGLLGLRARWFGVPEDVIFPLALRYAGSKNAMRERGGKKRSPASFVRAAPGGKRYRDFPPEEVLVRGKGK